MAISAATLWRILILRSKSWHYLLVLRPKKLSAPSGQLIQ